VGLALLLVKYALLAGLLAFVVWVLREMMGALPPPAGADPRAAHPSAGSRVSGAVGVGALGSGGAAPPGSRRAAVKEAVSPRPAQPSPSGSDNPPGRLPRPVAAGPQASLIVLEPGDTSLRPQSAVSLTAGVHIGRAPSNDVVLEDQHVSRQHAYLGRRGKLWVLVDKGSVNGTFVNGRRLTRPCALRDGDVVTIGGVQFLFRLVPSGDSGAQPRPAGS
jgi:hypothetical protein